MGSSKPSSASPAFKPFPSREGSPPPFSPMAGDVTLKSGDDNACCSNWKEKYAKLEEKRNALRQAVRLLELQLDKVQAECAAHKNACDLERARADLERQEKEKLIKVQEELEDNICSLKSEVSSFRQKDCADAGLEKKVKLLEAKVSKGEAEIMHLKELLKKERSQKNGQSEKKRSAEAWKALEAEKSRADEERKISAVESRKAEQFQLEVERLKKEVDGFRLRLVIEMGKCEETTKKLELEREKTMKKEKRADKEKAKADEQRKLADESNRKLTEEKAHVVKLCEEVEAGTLRIKILQEEKDRLLDDLNRSIMEKKDQVDKFSKDVAHGNERFVKYPDYLNKLPVYTGTGMTKTLGTVGAKWDNGLSENFPSVQFGEAIGNLNCQKQKASTIMETDSEMVKGSGQLEVATKSSKRVMEECNVGNLSNDLAVKRQRIESFQHQERIFGKPPKTRAAKSSRCEKVGNMKLKLCKEQLKLEKMKAKHAKEVLEFEKRRNSILSKEIRQMRFDFGQFSRRLDMLDSFVSPNSGGVYRVGKNVVGDYMDVLKNSQLSCEPCYPCSLVDAELVQPSRGGSSSDFVSGTDSQLEFSRGGSHRNKLQSSAINSAVASFSDRVFLGSQDRAYSPAAIEKMVKDESNWPATISKQSDEVETESTGKVAGPAENSACRFLPEGNARIDKLEPKGVRSIKLTDSTDEVSAYANKEHFGGLGDYVEGREESSGTFCSDLDGVVNLTGADVNYMQLLELDNVTDEIHYKLATERLLSPLRDSDLEVIEANAVVEDVSERIGPPKNYQPLVVIGSGATVRKLDCAPYGTECGASLFGKQYGCAQGAPPEFCVISSDVKDRESILKIFNATRSCMLQASSPSQTGCPVPVVSVISLMEEKLQLNEKICVLFSVLLLKLSQAWPGNAGGSLNRDVLNCIDSFNELLTTVMADDKTRSLFEEESRIDYLLKIIEDFLIDGRVAFFPSSCSGPIVLSTGNLGIALNGDAGLFLSKTSSTDLLVGGGIVLASICAITDRVGFICEASYRIFQMHRSAAALLLTVLHAFAYICGQHYFIGASYGMLMGVLKSLVTYIEGSFASENSSGCPMLLGVSDVRSSLCIRCPFSVEAFSVDVVTSVLLKKVEKTVLSSEAHSDEAATFSLSKSGRLHFEDIDQHNACDGCLSTVSTKSIDMDVRGLVGQYTTSAVSLEKKSDANSNHTIELLSQLELIANVMGWEFMRNKIVPQLLKIFKSCALETTAAGVMILIGQLGRIGVVACGYDDVGVNTLRRELCDVVGQVSASGPSFTVQTAILNALLSLLPLDFADIVENAGETLASISQPAVACSIRKWYSSLSRERQIVAHNILQSTALDKESGS